MQAAGDDRADEDSPQTHHLQAAKNTDKGQQRVQFCVALQHVGSDDVVERSDHGAAEAVRRSPFPNGCES